MIRSHFSSVILRNGLEAGAPRVVHEDERRPELGADPVGRGLDRLAVGHVDAADRQRPWPSSCSSSATASAASS